MHMFTGTSRCLAIKSGIMQIFVFLVVSKGFCRKVNTHFRVSCASSSFPINTKVN